LRSDPDPVNADEVRELNRVAIHWTILLQTTPSSIGRRRKNAR
jgi:hypothetical protein